MGAYGTVTTGLGNALRVFRPASADDVQVVREHSATAVTRGTWSASTTASTSQIAADVNRVALLITSLATARVYLTLSSTTPTSSVFDYYLDPGDRWEVPIALDELAVSFVSDASGGTVYYSMATAS